MFKHHKYCVVEISGLLVAYEDERHVINVFVIDADSELKGRLLSIEANNFKAREALLGTANSERIRITDQKFIGFLVENAPAINHSCYKHVLEARITSTVSPVETEVQFTEVSQAVIKDSTKTLKYDG